jgi:selenocysteine lyase/cysteine desulfurase
MRPGPSKPIFDAAALKREFPGLANPQLHYLNNAATAQVPDVVLNARRRFKVEWRVDSGAFSFCSSQALP